MTPGLTRPLADYLIGIPAGAERLTSTYGSSTAPSIDLLVSSLYAPADRADVKQMLSAEGLEHVGHRGWIQNGEIVDVLIEQFGNADGAEQRYDSATTGARVADFRDLNVSGPGDPQAYAKTTPDADGYIVSQSAAHLGVVVVEVEVLAKGATDQHLLQAVTQQQTSRLPGA